MNKLTPEQLQQEPLIQLVTKPTAGVGSTGGRVAVISAFDAFRASFAALAVVHHQRMVEKGFWQSRHDLEAAALDYGGEELRKQAVLAVDCQINALIHTEVSECVEGLRHGNPPDDKVPEFSAAEAEMADVIIRILDYAGGRGLRVGDALVAKMGMNLGREKMHGKQC